MIHLTSLWTRTFGGLVLLTATCGSGPIAPGQQRLPTGQWGGQHVGMEVSDSGAQLEFDCAHGGIDEAIVLSKDGRFDVKGTYAQERPGPRREDDNAARPVRYVGEVEGKTMRLTIRAGDGSTDAIGSYTLEHGKAGVIRKCQ